MKSLLLLSLSLLLLAGAAQAQSQSDNPREFSMQEGDTVYVMKKYFLCLLKTGPNRNQTEEEAKKIQEGHMAHINKLAAEGKIHLAGPMGDDGDIRGILVFDVETLEEAYALEGEDPAVKAGRLIMDIHPWWAAKGSKLN
jgi:uncharacterized protein YciI